MSQGLPRRLYRSHADRMLGGVSGGLAAYFDIDPVLVRLLWVLGAALTSGAMALAYLVLWVVVPEEGYAGPSSGVVRGNVNEMATEARRMADEVRDVFRRNPSPAATTSPAQEVGITEQPSTQSVSPANETGAAEQRSVQIVSPAGDTGTAEEPAQIVSPAEDAGTTEQPPAQVVSPAEVTGTTEQPSTQIVSAAEAQEARRRRSMMAGVILLVLGVLFLAGNLGFSRWFNLDIYWPVFLVALGALLLWNRSRSGS